ncbi:MAG: DEAD/DEAH box helicase family protein [Candidatus Moduliflexus flocculans]|nr:DEAD/DEAH box helicase family protein [Candidatus Moduliflexus flocculans]
MKSFKLVSEFSPKGDQVQAIERLTEGLAAGARHQVLKGVTGSGKTFTMANIIETADRPVLVVSHNKTLAAQLYQEFRRFFPGNAVEYFVSYYDYYQPEAFIPASNTYIAKEATINDEIDRLRLCATNSLFSRRDVIIVASVSCIYGIGAPETYYSMSFPLTVGDALGRKALLDKLVSVQYEREEGDFKRGTFRVRGDIVEVFPSYEDSAYRIELEDGRIKAISAVDPLLGRVREALDTRSWSTPAPSSPRPPRPSGPPSPGSRPSSPDRSTASGAAAWPSRPSASRSGPSTTWRCSREFGYCPGIENYSRHLTGRAAGEPPYTLLDYFPKDFLTIIDESHVTVPQIGGMYAGDRSRKLTLVEHGFRLPSALDNRPLNFDEFEAPRRPDPLRLGHARPLRDQEVAGPGRRAGHPARPA